jgi:RND superfamily putative drug exporter
MERKKNLAARAGMWSARHRKTAIIGWLVFVVLAIGLGGKLGMKEIKDGDSGHGQSGRADQILASEFEQPAGEQVLIQGSSSSDPAFKAAVADVASRLEKTGTVTHVRTPYEPGNLGQISKDGKSVTVTFDLKGDSELAAEKVDASLKATTSAQRAHPDLLIEQFGAGSVEKSFDKSQSDDMARARFLSLPITLVILVFAFGALVAAGIPVLLAVTGVIATLGLIAIPSQLSPISPDVSEVILLVGMAVGVDYSLFYMRREREERNAGRSQEAALEAAAATSGRSVLISGLTVIAAMAGMYFTGDSTFQSFGTGTILVVAVAMLGSLTVLPAVLSKLGDRVMKGRVPFLAKRRESGKEGRVWSAILDRVLRRPLVSIIVAGGILVALTVPVLGMHTALSGSQGLPKDMEVAATLKRIDKAFPGGPEPAAVVVKATDVTSAQSQVAIKQLESRALATGQMSGPVQVDVNPAHTVAVVSIPLHGNGTDAESNRALETLREDVVPATVGRLPAAETAVTGNTAGSKDFNDQMKKSMPLVFAFVLAMAFLLLLVTFRSIVIPIKAILLNLLSVGAAYGVLVLVFQHGWGESLLGFESTGAVTSWLPLFLFVILFGLSMDYHVFILSRVREAFDNGMSTEDAVSHGIKSTAGVVTSAAIVMVAVFGIFATMGALDMKMMGVGLATAVLIDATLVRAVLLPATMKLLGDWNWYLPRKLGWLPQVAHEPEVVPAQA